jgi:glucosamine-6-phosphate deaminase
MDARQVVLVVQGKRKAAAVAALGEGLIAAMVPGSVLQSHRFTTVVIEEDAASRLTMSDYYRTAFDHNPDRQHFDRVN